MDGVVRSCHRAAGQRSSRGVYGFFCGYARIDLFCPLHSSCSSYGVSLGSSAVDGDGAGGIALIRGHAHLDSMVGGKENGKKYS